jgi:hypothetical protein
VIFVAAIHFALRYGREPLRGLLLRCGSIAAASAATFVALRVMIGEKPAVVSAAQVMGENFASPMWWVYALAFFGALWLLPFRGWRAQPAELRRLLLVLIPYLLLQIVFGRIREVRLLLPLALPLIPMALARLRTASEGDPPDDVEPTWGEAS